MYGNYIKPVIDFLFGSIIIIIILPVILIVSLLVCIRLGRPILFKQKRPGKQGKPFNVYKFRSMTNMKDIEGKLLPDDERLTDFGRSLRNSSLDELPQFINVLKGDISIVGPRPLIFEYLELYNEEQKRRHDVKPGITGWAQVNGRNNISWKEKFELDVWYVDHISLKLDLRILYLTLRKVIKREGINKEGQATTEAFNGEN